MARLTRRQLLEGAAAIGAAALLGEPLADALGATSVATRRHGRRYVSRPDLQPPKVTILQAAHGRTAPGLLFLGPSSGPGQRGAMIIDDHGELVWFHPTKPNTVMNFRAAVYKGEPVLTWWEGKSVHGLGVGEHVVFDRTYKEVARFPAGNGLGVDLHELIVTPAGTALVTAYDIQTVDRSSVGSSRGPVIEGVVQELEIPSARVLFEWRSLDHVAVSETYQPRGRTLDYFHVNSIDEDFDGNLVVSARNTWAIYKIDRGSGKVIWRLGGKKSDFSMGPGTDYAWQHDARMHDKGTNITIFDNGSVLGQKSQSQSRGLSIDLDLNGKHATLVEQYVHRPPQLAHALGSCQRQPNGNVLVGFGTEPAFTEYTADGTVVFDATLPRGGQNYRTLRFPWVGAPTELPRVAPRTPADGRVYASWNGATEVAKWQLLTGPANGPLVVRTTTPKQGFETPIPVGTEARRVAVVALDRAGKPLGRSAVVAL